MAKNVANQRSYSDLTSGVWVAPLGTAPPTGPLPAPWGPGFRELGLITDKGVIENAQRQKTKKWNWQGNSAGRSLYTQPEHTFDFECSEENALVLGLARPGSTVVTTGGTAEVQTVTVTATANPFTLTYGGATTTPIPGTSAAAAVQAAVQALPGLGTASVSGAGPYAVTLPQSQGNAALLGATNATVVETTPGVAAINRTNVVAYTGTDFRSFGVDLVDGGIHRRFYVPVGDATLTGAINNVATDLAIYPFTVDCYPDAFGTLVVDLNDNTALSATA